MEVGDERWVRRGAFFASKVKQLMEEVNHWKVQGTKE